MDERRLLPAMEAINARIQQEPDQFTRFMMVYVLYNPLFPSCGEGEGAGFKARVLAAWDAAVLVKPDGTIVNAAIKRDLLCAASHRVFYLVTQLAPQDPSFAGLSLCLRPEAAARSVMPNKRSEAAWFGDRLEAYALLNDITGIFATISMLTPRPSPYDNLYPYQPYYTTEVYAPVLRYAAPLAKSCFHFRRYRLPQNKGGIPVFKSPFISLETPRPSKTQKGKAKAKSKLGTTNASSGLLDHAGVDNPCDALPQDPPPKFSQEYFQEIALPITEDARHPHRTNLAKKAARLQELKKTMNDVGNQCISSWSQS
jgi:hypothetical protein